MIVAEEDTYEWNLKRNNVTLSRELFVEAEQYIKKQAEQSEVAAKLANRLNMVKRCYCNEFKAQGFPQDFVCGYCTGEDQYLENVAESERNYETEW